MLGTEIWSHFLGQVFALGGAIASDAAYLPAIVAKLQISLTLDSAFVRAVVARQQSAFAFGLLLRSPVLAAALQLTAIAFAGWAVAMTWKKKRPLEERSMILCCGTLLATPYLYDYDLVLLAVPIALLGRRGLVEGFLPWQKSLLGALWVLPALGWLATSAAHIPATVILLVLSITIFARPAMQKPLAGKIATVVP